MKKDIDIKYEVLKNYAEELLRKIADYENLNVNNEEKLKYDIEDVFIDMMGYYKGNFNYEECESIIKKEKKTVKIIPKYEELSEAQKELLEFGLYTIEEFAR